MDKESDKLSKSEIEELCRLYLDARLTRREEDDLALVLSHLSHWESEIIEDTLFLMGLSDTVGRIGKNTTKAKRKRWFLRLIQVSSVAVVILAAVLIGRHFFNSHGINGGEIYEVYAYGERVADPEQSRRMALESYHASMELIARMEKLEKEKLAQIEKLHHTPPSFSQPSTSN